MLEKHGLEISSLAYYPNNLHPDPSERRAANTHLRKVIDAAAKLGVPIVGTFVGRDQTKNVPDNFREFRKVWPRLVDHAESRGVKIAIENCPMIFSYDEWPGGTNLASTPAVWDEMFSIVDSPSFGLNLDPSHLVWLMIDYERVVRDYAAKIFHVHAKDLEIDRDGLYRNGTISLGMGWQVPRLPGLGEVRWDRFVAALYRAGYDYVVSVEHEDRTFEGTRGARQARVPRSRATPCARCSTDVRSRSARRRPSARRARRSRRGAVRERRSRQRADELLERVRLERLRERELLLRPGDLPRELGRSGLDRRDDLLHRRRHAREVRHVCAVRRRARGERERPADVGREVVLRRAAVGDLVPSPRAAAAIASDGPRGQALVAAGPVDDVRPDPDRGDALVVPEDPRRPLVRELVHAVERRGRRPARLRRGGGIATRCTRPSSSRRRGRRSGRAAPSPPRRRRPCRAR